MTVSPVDGRLYISDFMSHKIIRVKTMGPVRSLLDNYEDVAGNGEECTPGEEDLCGDGGPAIQAKLRYPKGGFCWGLQQTSGFCVSRWNSINWGAEGVLEERELDKTVFEDFQGQFLLLLLGGVGGGWEGICEYPPEPIFRNLTSASKEAVGGLMLTVWEGCHLLVHVQVGWRVKSRSL